MAASLRKKYYACKIEALHSADAHSWWKKTKQFLDSKQPNPFQNLQQELRNLSLEDLINDVFVSVSEHLPPSKNGLCGNTIAGTQTQDHIIMRAQNTGYRILMCISH